MHFRVGETAYRVSVRRSGRARRATISLVPGAIEVILPRNTDDALVVPMLESRRDWLAARLRPPKLGLERVGVVWLALKPVPVTRVTGRSSARLVDGHLVVGGFDADAAAAVDRWYRRVARVRLEAAAVAAAARLAVDYRAVAVRDQRSRWGSCSSSGVLSFSWRLVLAPDNVLDYVVVHELAHRKVMDHSYRFWRLLDERLSDWRTAASWLNCFGGELAAYKPETAIVD